MILMVVGTRPEIVKMASVVDACRKLHVDHQIVHATQHYDWEMSGQFLRELGFPKADHHVDVGSGSPAMQTSKAMIGLERVILKENPDAVVVQGDTNTVLGSALASVKIRIPVCHVEAGLRSYDTRMPEEHNRRLVDHMSSVLFAPTSHAAATLRRERTWGRIVVTGNTAIDACLEFAEKAMDKSRILDHIMFQEFVLATFHRAENVDYRPTLGTIVKVLAECPVPVVFPVHPRTMDRLRKFHLVRRLSACEKVQLLPALGYLDILSLMMRCTFVITDSGGIQEEATAPNIRKFVFVLRRRTDRPESVRAGFARVVGDHDADSILRAIRHVNHRIPLGQKSPYGDGKAGLRIARDLKHGSFTEPDGHPHP